MENVVSLFYNKTFVNCLHNGIDHTLNHFNNVALERVTLLLCNSIDNDMVNVPFVFDLVFHLLPMLPDISKFQILCLDRYRMF